MDIGAVVGTVTVVAGVLLGSAKIVQDHAVLRRLERLVAIRESIPRRTIARANIDEALDWQTLVIVHRERNPRSTFSVVVGFIAYLLGVAGMTLTPTLLIDRRASEYSPIETMSVYGIGFASVLFLIGGVLLIFGPSSFRKRRLKLRALRVEESKAIVNKHRRHDVG